MPEQTTTSYAVPVAIVIAGLLIAGAVYFRAPVAPTSGTASAVNEKLAAVAAPSSTDHIRGSLNAPLVIIDYSDTECPFCKRFHEGMIETAATYNGKVAWIYRHFPLDGLHKKARPEAEATECVAKLGGEEAFWKYLDQIYAETSSNDGLDLKRLPIMATALGISETDFNTCVQNRDTKNRVERDVQTAEAAGGTGTPFPIILSKSPIKANLDEFTSQGFIELSPDKTKVALKGALPKEILFPLLDKILGK